MSNFSTNDPEEIRCPCGDARGRGPSAVPCAPGCCAGAAEALGECSRELPVFSEAGAETMSRGNAIAALRQGETALYLGCGRGIDCFLAAHRVGAMGTVIGVDMSLRMITKARDNASKLCTKNVEFRLGELEHLPVADSTIDAIISDCVINLSPSKPDVFREAFRVLRPGGRIAISGLLAAASIPLPLRAVAAAVCGRVGAVPVTELSQLLIEAGFKGVRVDPYTESRAAIPDWMPGGGVEDYLVSANIEAVKLSNEC